MELKLSSNYTRLGLNALGMLGIAVALWLGESIFVPFTISILLAAILWPVVRWFNRRLRIPWTISCFISVGLLLLFVGIITFGFVLAVPRMLQGLPNPNDRDKQQAFYSNFREQIKSISPGNIDSVLPEKSDESRLFLEFKKTLTGEYVTQLLLKLGGYLNSWLLQMILVMFVLLFLLMEGRMLTQRIVEVFGPTLEAQSAAVETLSQIAKAVRSYLVWRSIVNFGLAILLGFAFQLIGLKQAWTWALLAGVLCYIPYIGTILAGVPPVLDAFVFVGPKTALAVLLFYIIVVTIEGYLIVPLVMGRSVDLNATTVMLACLFWDLVWGTPGLFLAMPLMAALKAVCENVPGWRPWANLVGNDRSPAPIPTQATAPLMHIDPDPEKTVVIEPPPTDKRTTGGSM